MTVYPGPDLLTASSAAARVGVLIYDATLDVDAIFQGVVDNLRAQGRRVGGLMQRFGERQPSGKRSMFLRDVASGRELRIDAPRGPGAVACVLDPDALAEAACLLRLATEDRADLLLVNRFGAAEVDGQGMRAELAEAICSGAPVLVAVRGNLLAALERFLGTPAHVLPPSIAAVTAWAASWSSPLAQAAE